MMITSEASHLRIEMTVGFRRIQFSEWAAVMEAVIIGACGNHAYADSYEVGQDAGPFFRKAILWQVRIHFLPGCSEAGKEDNKD